jgi:hypothetical protein
MVRVSTLVELGMSRATVHHRCRKDGPWQRVLPGVVALHRGPLRRVDMLHAALVYAGEGAMITGLDACRLHGLRNVPESTTVHVLVPDDRQYSSTAWVKIERTTRLPTATQAGGVRAAPLIRAVLDAARFRRTEREVLAMLTETVQRRRCSTEELRRELDAGSKFGSALPRRILREMVSGVQSVAEAQAKLLLRGLGLPAPLWNRQVVDSSGKRLGRPDAWFDDVALAWEIDSVEYHTSPDDYAATMAKHSRMAAAGVIVVHTLPSWLRTRPDEVRAELRKAYEQAKRRPRPPLLALPAAA